MLKRLASFSITLIAFVSFAACSPVSVPTTIPTLTSTSTYTPTPILTATPTPTKTPEPTPTPSVRSGNSEQRVTLVIDNKMNQTLNISWVNYYWSERPYVKLEPLTSTININSFATHAWLVRDDNGTVISSIILDEEAFQRYEIAADGTFKRLRLQSDLVNLCKLNSRNAWYALGFSSVASALPKLPSVGTLRVKALFVDFSDAPAQQTPAQMFSLLSLDAADFFKTASYGRLTLKLEPHLIWLRMSKPSVDYHLTRLMTNADLRAYIEEAIQLADPEVNFSDVQAVYVVSPPTATAIESGHAYNSSAPLKLNEAVIYSGGNAGNSSLRYDARFLSHEMSHNMGLPDLYVVSSDLVSSYDTYKFAGNFSLMSRYGRAPEYFAYERWSLGWLDDNQIFCQPTGTQTTTLSAIETVGGTKAVVIPTSTTTAVVVESRRALGYDKLLLKPGALVYSINTGVTTGLGPINVLPIIDGDPYRDQSPLAVGQSVTVGKVTITVVSADLNGDTVKVVVVP